MLVQSYHSTLYETDEIHTGYKVIVQHDHLILKTALLLFDIDSNNLTL